MHNTGQCVPGVVCDLPDKPNFPEVLSYLVEIMTLCLAVLWLELAIERVPCATYLRGVNVGLSYNIARLFHWILKVTPLLISRLLLWVLGPIHETALLHLVAWILFNLKCRVW
ncbi:hypothetical protein VNO77_21239 [Canavalia gladiata]|uniref:Uncharacterized protein n=1 Tax=Canavalia gladiata TaxID=3824 RepID=A0AAN9QRC5_CANGL